MYPIEQTIKKVYSIGYFHKYLSKEYLSLLFSLTRSFKGKFTYYFHTYCCNNFRTHKS